VTRPADSALSDCPHFRRVAACVIATSKFEHFQAGPGVQRGSVENVLGHRMS
jgi:hypothetical protein